MMFDFAARIGSLPDERRLSFYEGLAHNLTIAVRAIWSDNGITDAEKVDRMKSVNEILHRVTAKVWHVRLKLDWTEVDFAVDIQHRVSQNPEIAGYVGWAIEASFRVASFDRAQHEPDTPDGTLQCACPDSDCGR